MNEKFERKFRSTADGFAAKNGGYPIYSVEWTDGMIDGVNAALLSIVKTDFFGHDEKDKAEQFAKEKNGTVKTIYKEQDDRN